jgi:hypothetical protein
VATKAILALGMPCGERLDATGRMAGETILFQFNPMVGEIERDGWIVIARAREQDKKHNNRDNQRHEDKVGWLGAKSHL